MEKVEVELGGELGGELKTGPRRGKELLRQLHKKGITFGKFLEDCAYWGMEYLSEYRYRPLSTNYPDKERSINHSNYQWLKHLQEIIPPEDTDSHQALSIVCQGYTTKSKASYLY